MPQGSASASARGGALPPYATKVVMQMFHARYPALPNVFTAISNASKQAGTQLSCRLQHCSASCGVWCKAVLVQYPLHKLPVPSVLKAALQQAQGAISHHQPQSDAARSGQDSLLTREALKAAYATARHRRSLADEWNWQAVLLQHQQQQWL